MGLYTLWFIAFPEFIKKLKERFGKADQIKSFKNE